MPVLRQAYIDPIKSNMKSCEKILVDEEQE